METAICILLLLDCWVIIIEQAYFYFYHMLPMFYEYKFAVSLMLKYIWQLYADSFEGKPCLKIENLITV